MSDSFETSTQNKPFSNGWTLFTEILPPDPKDPTTIPDKKTGKAENPHIKLDLLLRTPKGVQRAHIYTRKATLRSTVFEGSIIEPGTETSSGGDKRPFKLVIQDSSTAHLSAKGGPWVLKRPSTGGKQLFAYLTKFAERGESTDLADLLDD